MDQRFRWLSRAQEGLCPQIHTFILGSTGAWKQRTLLLLRQRSVLTFSNFGFSAVGLLPRPEICIKGPRKIHPKINMKAKTSCQELQPHTSCWLVPWSLSSQLWLFQTERKPAPMTRTWCQHKGLMPQSSSVSMEWQRWFKSREERSEVIRSELNLKKKREVFCYLWVAKFSCRPFSAASSLWLQRLAVGFE